jgi:hypothetical protein
MSAPTLDRTPAASTSSPAARRSRRPLLLLVATSLLLVAAAVGTSVALANRPLTRQPSVAVDTPDPVTPGVVTPDQPADQGVDQITKPEQNTEPGPGVTDVATPVLPDGPHDAYIRQVDKGRKSIVVDVVQVFHDDAAVKAAIADGQSRDQARYLSTYVRNQNPRLRTLPLAANLRVQLRDSCGDPSTDRAALLTKLAANARQEGVYYYRLTVSGGAVQRIQERLAVNAC